MKPITGLDFINEEIIKVKHNKRFVEVDNDITFNVGEIPYDTIMRHIYSCVINNVDKNHVYDKFRIERRGASHTSLEHTYRCRITINNKEIRFNRIITKKIKDFSFDLKFPNYKNRYLFRFIYPTSLI
jgi:hypothetical protein